MALSQEDLAAIAALVDSRVQAAAPPAAPVVEDSPDVAARKAAEPVYYVHLADGRVVESQDNSSTHMDGVQVIGRYAKGEDTTEVAPS